MQHSINILIFLSIVLSKQEEFTEICIFYKVPDNFKNQSAMAKEFAEQQI